MALLINEPPLYVLPSLARKIGLYEAVVLQRIHDKLQNPYKRVWQDNRAWTFNSFDKWIQEFNFLPESILRQTLQSLIDCRLLIKGCYATNPLDLTHWYTIDYEVLHALTNPGSE